MASITVFTPTFNREFTLNRVYDSLLKQSCKDFTWLIIDDGSNDNTRELVNSWIAEKKLNINYYYKTNGGKHTAMRLAYQLIATQYMIAIDSDDELTPDAVLTFKDEWSKIEAEGLSLQFAEVSGLTHTPDNKLIGDFYFPVGKAFIDSNWHEMVLKLKNNNEHIVCWDMNKLKECVQIPEHFWLSDKVNFFGESILWARIGRKYKTRYINKCLRIYHTDTGDSLLRINDKRKGFYNILVGNKYFLDENLDYFFWNPTYFIHLILKFIISVIELNYSPFYLMRNINTMRFRFVFLIFLPFGYLVWFYFKYIKHKFWF